MKTCYGCKHLKSKSYADGSRMYFCWRGETQPATYDNIGGVVIGTEDRDPEACEHYEDWRKCTGT